MWPVLKSSYRRARKMLLAGVKYLPHAEELVNAFPFVEIVKSGLSAGDYWASFAMNWVDEFDHSQRQMCVNKLLLLVEDENRVFSRTRRRAVRQLRGRRAIFPFVPKSLPLYFDIDSQWKTGTVRTIAQKILEEPDCQSGTLDQRHLAILADALEDAGCNDTAPLTHLRKGGRHTCRCLVVTSCVL
jgi:hypothetical protein